ncbi:RxLR-like protein [Plasmopara halstedii]|uniref:RxLR-like protein n=1 Tax=Plasmopara halstedii TaxID=4781 RepID=A0A0P1ACX1_PLAHL|nr:RxLR-like protein [Plasmopara halstedii]CEG38205.1 RxLR-like protein [Plasmopara halstedii]|eukprot:XP_024574574.1 RxLR-like protein [Plasmopara halstedii]
MRRRVKFVLVLTAIALATNVIASVTPVPSPQPSERDATDFEAKKSVKPENMNDGAVQDFNVEERTALHGIEDVEMLGHSTESFGNKMLHLKNEDEKDEYRLVDLENLRVEALLVEIFALTTDEKIDEASQKIRRFAVDLDPYFIERPSEGKEILHSTATLAAEVRRKRPRQ